MSKNPITTWLDRNGRLLRIRLARPTTNIVDIAMIEALETTLQRYEGSSDLLGVVLDHEGPHFGYGASIPEHMPEKVNELVSKLHRMLKRMLAFPVPILVVVRGQCLGGSLEVVIAGHLIFVSPDAKLGQPEVRLGTMAPVGSCILPERIGRALAEDLLISGRSISAETARAIGLVNDVSPDPESAALAYFDKYLAPLSSTGIRFHRSRGAESLLGPSNSRTGRS